MERLINLYYVFSLSKYLYVLICSLYIAWNCMSSCNGHIMINRFHKAINHQSFSHVCVDIFVLRLYLSYLSIAMHTYAILLYYLKYNNTHQILWFEIWVDLRPLNYFCRLKFYSWNCVPVSLFIALDFCYAEKIIPDFFISSWRCIRDNLTYIFVIVRMKMPYYI